MTRRNDDWAGSSEYHREIRRTRLIQFGAGVIAICCFALVFAVVARAEAVDGNRIVVIDGDTVALPGNPAERIRIYNIDAPETRNAHCEAELTAGLKAKERLAQLLRGGPVTVDRCEPSGRCTDPYGRTLARLSAGGRDLGGVLVSEGRALPWSTGAAARAARTAYWCGAQ
ncbi:thermonuclease family protein [Bosea sp. (in: a-proteobacteria)]|uniref:thermonuclease family protein n=1 Tax=Bosea sp. (in: a-proteobacteria) TaxID=1871050 RepID=UPI002732F4B0|nr:thermonuclease family protein [Bosea sp. (in: a-proteobacteria)]MDP3407272.1 thermonuclease family protein [Bosea sp. (in: a-proteobacteria)]